MYNGELTYPDVWAEPWPDLIAGMRNLRTLLEYRHCPIDARPPAGGLCVSEPTGMNIHSAETDHVLP